MSAHHANPGLPIDEFRRFMKIVRRLRRDCPWDRKQTHRSLRGSLIEESYEVVEAIDNAQPQKLREELGDLLLHFAMQTTIAEELKEFTLRDVLREISEKLIRRHPHIYGNSAVRNAADVRRNWETIKLREGRRSVLEGVPRRLPVLQRALRVQQRAAKVGFDWKKKDDVWKKVREEILELREVLHRAPTARREEEFGDLLFALVNYARFLDVDPEGALRKSVEKFTKRFQFIERELRKKGRSVHTAGLKEMDRLWNASKRPASRRRPAA